jgi:hypothetical protein
MGDAKRRKEQMGNRYGDPDQELIFPQLKFLALTKGQAKKAYNWTTRGAWAGIIFLAIFWIVVRFIGPFFGWWEIAPLE